MNDIEHTFKQFKKVVDAAEKKRGRPFKHTYVISKKQKPEVKHERTNQNR